MLLMTIGPESGSMAGGSGRSSSAGTPRVHLASRSPRRRELLTGAGIEHDAGHPGLDDAQLAPSSVQPCEWVEALAYLKARSALTRGGVRAPVVLGADTIVVKNGTIISAPSDAADARRILMLLRDGSHEVLTGVALLDVRTGRRRLFNERASVTVGWIDDATIDQYVASNGWVGKAGGYNLSERVSDGWPISFSGDPGTIMGLPIEALKRHLAEFAAA